MSDGLHTGECRPPAQDNRIYVQRCSLGIIGNSKKFGDKTNIN